MSEDTDSLYICRLRLSVSVTEIQKQDETSVYVCAWCFYAPFGDRHILSLFTKGADLWLTTGERGLIFFCL